MVQFRRQPLYEVLMRGIAGQIAELLRIVLVIVEFVAVRAVLAPLGVAVARGGKTVAGFILREGVVSRRGGRVEQSGHEAFAGDRGRRG